MAGKKGKKNTQQKNHQEKQRRKQKIKKTQGKNKDSRKYQKAFIELGKGTSIKGNPDWGVSHREIN